MTISIGNSYSPQYPGEITKIDESSKIDASSKDLQSTIAVKAADRDSIEISEQGREYQKITSANPESAPSAAPATAKASSSDSSALKMLSSEEDEEEDSSVNLATLTEQQIRNLVNEGSITQAQAAAELAKREEQP